MIAGTSTGVVAIVVPAIAREGITKMVLSQIKGLQERGFHIVLIVLSTVSKDVLKEFNTHLSADQLLELKQQDAYLSKRNLLTAFLLLAPIIKFLRNHKVRVVIAHAPYSHYVMRLVKLKLQFQNYDVKLIQYFHITQYAQFPLNNIRRVLINAVNRVLCKNFDNVHVFVSKAVKEDVTQNLFTHSVSHIVYNALPKGGNDAETRSQTSALSNIVCVRPSAYIIVVPGRIENSKGQLFFIKVLNLFIKQQNLLPDDFQVFIIGEGAQRKEVQTEIEVNNLKEFISLPGSVANQELLQLMLRANLVVLPSFFEGLPLVALEAMQSRVLLLTSDIAAFNEIIEHEQEGFLFKVGDLADCLDKLRFIYHNRNTSLVDLDEVLKQVELKFSFEKHMAQLIQLIKLDETS